MYGAETSVFSNANRKRSIHRVKEAQVIHLILKVSRIANVNFRPPIFIHYQEEKLKEYINDHQRQNALIFYQILSTYFLREGIVISLENLYLDVGA